MEKGKNFSRAWSKKESNENLWRWLRRVRGLILITSFSFFASVCLLYLAYRVSTKYNINTAIEASKQILKSSELDVARDIKIYPPRLVLFTASRPLIGAYSNICFSNGGQILLPEYNPICVSQNPEIDENEKRCRKNEKKLLSRLTHLLCPSRRNDCGIAEKQKINNVNIKGSSAYFFLEESVTNVAHWTGKLGIMTHIIQRSRKYAGKKEGFDRVIVDANDNENVFKLMANENTWQGGSLRLLFPNYDVYLLPAVLDNRKELSYFPTGRQALFIVNGISSFSGTRGLCLERMVTTGNLHGRFFISDTEITQSPDLDYLSMEDKLHTVSSDARFFKKAAHKSIRTRDLKNGLIEDSSTNRKLVYMARACCRRIFHPTAEKIIRSTLHKFCKQNNFDFFEVAGENMTFHEQAKTSLNADIAVGLHGANLVNSMFLKEHGTLIEMMIQGIGHILFQNGGGSITGYEKLNISPRIVELKQNSTENDRCYSDVHEQNFRECKWVDFNATDAKNLFELLETVSK